MENEIINQDEILNQKIQEADKAFVEKIELDKLENNTVLIFRISNENINVIMSLPLLVKKYEEILKEKNISIIIMSPDEGVEALEESKMKRIGWVKENPSLIITPGQF